MKSGITHLVDLWKEGYSNHIEKYQPYQAIEQLKHVAALFSPGEFYYFILNMYNLELEYVHPGVSKFIDVNPGDTKIEELLTTVVPDDMASVQEKELLLREFMDNIVDPKQLPFYKMMYMYRMRDRNGKFRTMLLQVNVLSVSENGKVEHILSVHTDISYMGVSKTDKVSFISLNEGKSYYNIDPKTDPFRQENDEESGRCISELLTKRELEVIQLSSKGLNVSKMAVELNISEYTVRTHRKNMLKKTEFSNIPELVSHCVMEGLI
ncbi:LuxR C-terminal-related transcriptional regulator [Echinicola sp. 20G]|uniref:LuxR C-terminal-related transcriptional regulator n=1 Tax=Echinicola sp. 20G TaxID=2781961 RepID=UPI001F16E33B|nr:LuxR C-terminal-related transcriptional regulator [Echinicola sp. 20G]